MSYNKNRLVMFMMMYDVKFKKSLGQNFLKNLNVVKRIVDISGIDENSLVIEVGPGGGVMTKELAMVAKNVVAYEIDSDLTDELEKRLDGYDNVEVIFQDFLKSNIASDLEHYSYDKLFFVSNVPYYITTPIIMKIIDSSLPFENIVMMVQKEVGDRFCTAPGSKEYGSITVLLNYYYDIKKEFFVSKGNFVPSPNVDSLVVSFHEKKDKLDVYNLDFFKTIVRDSFQFKRKTLRNNLKKYDLNVVENVLKKHNMDLSVRAEMLSLDIFVEIANSLWN